MCLQRIILPFQSVHWRQCSLPERKEHGFWMYIVFSIFKYCLFHLLRWQLTFNESLLYAKHSSKFCFVFMQKCLISNRPSCQSAETQYNGSNKIQIPFICHINNKEVNGLGRCDVLVRNILPAPGFFLHAVGFDPLLCSTEWLKPSPHIRLQDK